MTKDEIIEAIDKAQADLAKVPVAGVADVAISILESCKEKLNEAKGTDFDLLKVVGAIATQGSLFYFDNQKQ